MDFLSLEWLFTAPGLAASLAVVLGAFWYMLRSTAATTRSNASPPIIDASMMETIRALGGKAAPFFVLEHARKLKANVFRLPIPSFPAKMTVVVADPDLSRTILADSGSTKPWEVYGAMTQVTGGVSNMFATNGSFWHGRRKGVSPAFSANKVKRMNTIAMEKADDWINTVLLPKATTGESFDAGTEMVSMMIDAIAETGFEYKPSKEEKGKFLTNMDLALQEFMLKSAVNPFRPLIGWLNGERTRAHAAAAEVETFSLKMLKAYRQLENPIPGTIVDLIAKNPAYKNDRERAADMTVFFIAGNDTTGYTMAFTMRELAKKSAFQAMLRAELQSLTLEEQHKSDLLRMAIREAIRMYPVSATGSLRTLSKDFSTADGKLLPKGSVAFMIFLATFRDGNIFPDPDSYNPLRWREATKEMNGAFIPFSLGKQNCVGQSLANAELHCILARILSQFELTIDDEGSIEYFLTMKPVGAMLKAKKV